MRAKASILVPLLLVISVSASAAASRQIHRIVPLDPAGRVSVEGHNGTVTVTTWAQASVGIDARIEPADWGGHPEDVQKANVAVSGQGAEVRIASDYRDVPTHIGWFGISQNLPPIHYTIHMPATARLQIEVHNADVRVDGVRSGLDVTTHNGGVDLLNLAGEAAVATHNGPITLSYAQFTAPGRISTHNGSCKVSIPAAARMTVRADTHTNRPITSDLPVAVRASGSDSVATVNGGGPELRFTAHNGSLRLSSR